MIANKLQPGDEIRVVAPSRSQAIIWEKTHHHAMNFWKNSGFNLTFSKNCRELDRYQSSSIASRVEDLHEAFRDPNVKMIISSVGGFNANQLLPYLDYDLIAQNPKILCGYSDITILENAIYAKTGIVTYSGPHYCTFGFDGEPEYTRKAFFDCLAKDEPLRITPSKTAKQYTVLQEGMCEGAVIGGNLCTINLLQGTPYMPNIRDKVLFVEDDNIMGEYFSCEFERNLQSLLQIEGADTVRGIVFGRFEESCGMTLERITDIIRDKVSTNIPIVFGVDFGHIFPIITFPIGGNVRIKARKYDIEVVFDSH